MTRTGPGRSGSGTGGRRPAAVRRVPTAPALRLSGAEGTPRLRGWLHLGAAVACLPASVALVLRGGGRPALVLYAIALVALYGVSAAYHLLPTSRRARAILRRTDHVMIYVYIAAAFTPFCLRVAPGDGGRTVLGLVWLGAAAGVTIKLVSFERTRALAGGLYTILGWLPVLVFPAALRLLDAGQIVLFVIMGVLYALGALVLATRRPDPLPHVFGYHELWHSAVILAGACYYLILWSLVAASG